MKPAELMGYRFRCTDRLTPVRAIRHDTKTPHASTSTSSPAVAGAQTQ